MERKIFNVILSGGSGTRLWPLSRESRPKQFLKMFGGLSLFQHTINRNKEIVDDFFVITNSSQINLAEEQSKSVDKYISKRIIEPVGRNTAPAIALAAFSLHDDDIMLVTPSDHMIGDQKIYKNSVKRAIELADDDFLVTFGIKPLTPNTGFGYIEHDGEKVVNFREKPDYETAKQFLDLGNFSWNSGMFCFKASVFLNELKKYNKPIYNSSKLAYGSINTKGEVDRELMLDIPSDSIDYAVLEKSDKIKVLLSKFYWTDLGTYDSIIDYFEQGNIVNGLTKNKTKSYIFSDDKQLFTSKSEIIVVDSEGVIVVLERNNTDKIKEIYKEAVKEKEELIK
ncbi:mannose-1-phosphate guanylyltransferase [Tenacibaculum sp. MEBiC06402]|uniref:mannose-1-phosphate guanylyltransferase n=1 Tax=unclassified Tenacibaculum TaxID=2635139 RepID=UPI003B9AC657